MSAHVHQWLDGLTGIEIGASVWNDFQLPHSWNISNDRDPNSIYRQEARSRGLVEAPIHRYDDGETLATFPENDVDFIFTSHVFEHFANPLGALHRWCEVIRPGGLIYMIVPQRDAAPSDRGRELTTLDHLLEDCIDGQTVATHPHDGPIGRPGGHYHVFTSQSLRDIIRITVPWLELVDMLDPDDQVANGFALVYRSQKGSP